MTKFADMPAGVRNRWLDWAQSHDWGAGEARWSRDGAAIEVEGVEFSAGDDVATVVPATFDNPAELRAWAGY